jgi:hypothetical protein
MMKMVWEGNEDRPRQVPFVWVVKAVASGPGVRDALSTMVGVGGVVESGGRAR